MELRPRPRRCSPTRAQLSFHNGHLTALFFLFLSSVKVASTQGTSTTSPSSSSVEMTSITSSTMSSLSTSTISPTTSITESSTNNTSISSTSISSTTSSISTRLPFPLPPGQTRPSAPSLREQREDSLVNIYFLLLGLGIIFVILGWWCFRRRKKEKRARSQDRGRNALARDLEGWVGQQRRWMYGGWRGASNSSMGGGTTTDAERLRAREEEGLNERGEAPPPYKPPNGDDPARVHGADQSRGDISLGPRPRSIGTEDAANAGQDIPLTDLPPPPPPPSPPRHPPPLHIAANSQASLHLAVDSRNHRSSPPKYETLAPPDR